MSARPKTPTHADEKHAVLYGRPIPENSFAVRDLQHKLPGVGLFDLRRTETGAHACTFCGACAKKCPVQCIDVRLDTLAHARQGRRAPLRRHHHRRRAALRHLQPLHGDVQVRRARAHRALHGAPAPGAGAGHQAAAAHRPATASAAAAAPASSSTRCSSQVKSHYVVSGATGCLEVSTTRYPYTAWKGSYIHTNFENAAATLSGVETAFRALYKRGKLEDSVKFIAFGGDGGTYDIGLQALSGAMERGHEMLYVCYDNGGYMNTGFQRSSATPHGAWTTTSPVGRRAAGQARPPQEPHRDHGRPPPALRGAVLAARPAGPDAQGVQGAGDRRADVPQRALRLPARLAHGQRRDRRRSRGCATDTCYWPLFEVNEGQYRLTYRPRHKQPARQVAGAPGPLRPPGAARQRAHAGALQEWVDEEWDLLLRKCDEIPEEPVGQGQQPPQGRAVRHAPQAGRIWSPWASRSRRA